MVEYRMIDADSHVNEPADVWQSRVPSALRERAPKLVELDGGRIAWSYDGGKRITPVQTALAGVDVTAYNREGARWSEVRPASYDPHARLEDMELDMIQAQVIYPGVALGGAHGYGGDRDLQLACVRAYNDWIHEFCSVAPDRLIGMPISPVTGIEDTLLEWRRVAERGARGFVISTYPSGNPEPSPEDDRFWSEVEDWEYPVHIHFGFFGEGPQKWGSDLAYLTSSGLIDMGTGVFRPIAEMLYDGLFERHSGLRIVAVETGIGWIPHYLQVLDDNFLRRRFRAGIQLKRMPGESFREHVWATFINDAHGLDNRHRIGVDRIMWSTDYPHTNSNWPDSQRAVAYEFKDIPPEEKRQIVRDNAARLYRLDAGL